MNEHLTERFSRSKHGKPATGQAQVWILPEKLNPCVREYYHSPPASGGPWLDRPEAPTAAEVLDIDDSNTDGSTANIVELEPNKPKGAWKTKEDYLSTQYELLREDSLRPLREAVALVKQNPAAAEDAFNGKVGVYEKTHICAIIPSTKGIAVRVTFSTIRAGKKILWEQSKRLTTGGLVVLTPATDIFKTTAIVATVGARPLACVMQNPPELDLFFARGDELEIDPSVEYIMVEDRSSFFEAEKHTLLALQRLAQEPFPLADHIVSARSQVPAPQYVRDHPTTDLTAILTNNKHETYENVDILRQWPTQPQSDLDASQLAAVQRILSKRLAVIQGPPGTGKTYVSVQAIRVMLANRKHDDPPIIVACQTNHAVDQLLRHIAEFEPEFLRLGGRSKDKDVIKKRTLFEVRNEISENPPAGCLFGSAKRSMIELGKEIKVLLSPLLPCKEAINHNLLAEMKIITTAQAAALEHGASKWIQDKKTNNKDTPFRIWLGDRLVPVPHKQPAEDSGFDYEEADLEFEQLKELEAENVTQDEDEFDTLRGDTVSIADNFTCRKVTGLKVNVNELLQQKNLWNIPEAYRGAVYRHLQQEMKKKIREAFREKAKVFDVHAVNRRIGRFEFDEPILKRQKIIGMTTTGLSKYRGLLAALKPNVCLIEEAGETLEAYVTAACVPSLQQLILVGDHKQLRPHTQVKAHEDQPYFLNISLFERLINNEVEYTTLTKQRRMIPEIRRILYPIYKKLIKDHASVLDPEKRPSVPGMGGVNSWFFTHQWTEQRDDHMSCVNIQEASMIGGFVEYLVYNGMSTNEITVLTFYNGQRKRILTDLRQRPVLEGSKFNIVTVDSYQGEENKVVLLSLVRSNANKNIGFLNVDNRVCVALSRAQCGFYLFGNGMLLHDTSKTWKKVIGIMAGRHNTDEVPLLHPNRLSQTMVVTCKNHGEETHIAEPEQWEEIHGGCTKKCGGKLPCGHTCALSCHPFSHEEVNCQACRERDEAAVAARAGRATPNRRISAGPGSTDSGSGSGSPPASSESSARLTAAAAGRASDSDSWQGFAETEPKRYGRAAAAAYAQAQSQSLSRMTNGSTPSPEKMGVFPKSGLVREAPEKKTKKNKAVPKEDVLLDFGEEEEEVKRSNFLAGGMGRLGLDGAGDRENMPVLVPQKAFEEDLEPARDWSREKCLLD